MGDELERTGVGGMTSGVKGGWREEEVGGVTNEDGGYWRWEEWRSGWFHDEGDGSLC